jgi:hypothetical protein
MNRRVVKIAIAFFNEASVAGDSIFEVGQVQPGGGRKILGEAKILELS